MKQQRPPQRAVDAGRAEARAPGSQEESTLGEQSVLGNQALAAQLDAGGEAVGEGTEAIRADAMALVERAVVALYTESRPAERVDRFVHVLEGSRLPADRKSVLVEKLVGDQEAAVAIERAAQRWFGGELDEARAAGLGAMDAVWAALTDDGLAVSDGVLQAPEGARGEQLVAELATRTGGEDVAEAVRGFCQEVYLIVAWHQDEDEEELSAAAPIPEEG